MLLGTSWTSCVGPTLGAASVMPAREENLLRVSATMLGFGLGAALPLLLPGSISRGLYCAGAGIWQSRSAVSSRPRPVDLGGKQ
ncbi:hypothetical protein GOC33_24260 [Sinorhizobium meliloti]|uniref:hypothetical protein n=1 Tax=Rhizobium meliloti TaxID=382 RepID=UPI000FD8E1FC|nr:hypothetical protein [Sinorhizobium meliloti]RVK30113.1 hypothetical protein CN163_27780 [Sinorhizobium meliloti]